MKNNYYKQLVLIFSAVLLSLFVLFTGCTSQTTGETGKVQSAMGQPRKAQEIIEEMVVDYGSYGEDASSRVDELLEELRSVDAGLGARWNRITKLWKQVNTDQELYYDVLPDGLPDTDELCIVALGFQLEPDGTMREELVERLKVVLASAKKYPNSCIVCTGGGTAAENESVTEAGEMAKWLIENGIEKDRVIVEDNSLTTAQNAIFTYDILTTQHPKVKKLAIISSDYHIAAGILLFTVESILRAATSDDEKLSVISNASWKAPSGALSAMFQAGALIELSGDTETAFKIYFDNYDIHELPSLNIE